ncbi:tubulin delta chain-like [Heteronotia binoei]|uniref:tubulin delta chain-like n=1 Tax=Heteronotia binoei TaxID=13085 RepID=UPI00292F13A8|nr:tubulin delta chain-like [Heteronotia binoei]
MGVDGEGGFCSSSSAGFAKGPDPPLPPAPRGQLTRLPRGLLGESCVPIRGAGCPPRRSLCRRLLPPPPPPPEVLKRNKRKRQLVDFRRPAGRSAKGSGLQRGEGGGVLSFLAPSALAFCRRRVLQIGGLMSAVWLQVGQCGNQIGQAWWEAVTRSRSRDANLYPFSSLDGKLSAICVDSEPKVVKTLQKRIPRGSFRESNLIVGKQGRGNNWAYGYHGVRSEGEQSLSHRTMESLRKEVERRDCYSGVVLFHSLSGGTGAGLSSRLCEAIRDEYPVGHILAVSVAPHQAGESPLQHYNALLCLSWLQRYTDGILLFHNDEVLKRAATLQEKAAAEGGQQVPLSAMNAYLASCLTAFLYPLEIFTTQSGISLGMEPWELLRATCPGPGLKFLHTAQASTRGTVFWDSLASSVTQSISRESPSGHPHCSSGLLAVARGLQEDAFLVGCKSVLRKLKQAYRCVPWNPFPATYWTDPVSLGALGRNSHTLTVCANHSSSADRLQRVEQRAWQMYKSKAYLHWYWRHGCEEGDFEQGFETLRSIVEDYSHLGD